MRARRTDTKRAIRKQSQWLKKIHTRSTAINESSFALTRDEHLAGVHPVRARRGEPVLGRVVALPPVARVALHGAELLGAVEAVAHVSLGAGAVEVGLPGRAGDALRVGVAPRVVLPAPVSPLLLLQRLPPAEERLLPVEAERVGAALGTVVVAKQGALAKAAEKADLWTFVWC